VVAVASVAHPRVVDGLTLTLALIPSLNLRQRLSRALVVATRIRRVLHFQPHHLSHRLRLLVAAESPQGVEGCSSSTAVARAVAAAPLVAMLALLVAMEA
jgi:hypothetical protein